jgi:hypothetical protein
MRTFPIRPGSTSTVADDPPCPGDTAGPVPGRTGVGRVGAPAFFGARTARSAAVSWLRNDMPATYPLDDVDRCRLRSESLAALAVGAGVLTVVLPRDGYGTCFSV